MTVKVASSSKKNIKEAINEIKLEFGEISPKVIIFFSSMSFAPEQINKEMYSEFSQSDIFGCTTAGEIVSGSMQKNSVVAMAFDSEYIADAKIEVIENLKEKVDVTNAFKSFQDYYKISPMEMDYKKYVGIVLIDGMSISEEKVMDKIGNLTDITFIGGSAGDDLKFNSTYIFANGKTYTNAAALVILEVNREFDTLKTQSFKILDKKLTATKVNENDREIIEFNNKPAAIAYAEALETTVDNLHNNFMRHPLGLVVENEAFVRSPKLIKNNSVIFYCNVKEGMDLSILESTNIIDDTTNAINKKKEKLGNISGIINFHCILRTLELESKGLTDEYGQIFKEIPTIGFSTYGEEYIGHVNQTSTMLIFK